MATDEERREVARNLRRYFKSYRSPTWRELFGIVFGESERYSEHRLNILIDRLADLIDPDGYECCDRISQLEIRVEKIESSLNESREAEISELKEKADFCRLMATIGNSTGW